MPGSKETIATLVHGAKGKMGQEVLRALYREKPEFCPVGGVDLEPGCARLAIPGHTETVPYYTDVRQAIAETRPNVLVDFTNANGCMSASSQAAKAGTNLVIGSTGLSQTHLDELAALCQQHSIGAIVAPNFALGAILLIRLARMAAQFFDYAEITEAHHESKADAPSGTALALAEAITENGNQFTRHTPQREVLPGTRGADYQGVALHSIRMPGRLTNHEVTFGSLGQTLSLRHDTISRECFMPGVLLAIREVVRRKGLVIGLDKII